MRSEEAQCCEAYHRVVCLLLRAQCGSLLAHLEKPERRILTKRNTLVVMTQHRLTQRRGRQVQHAPPFSNVARTAQCSLFPCVAPRKGAFAHLLRPGTHHRIRCQHVELHQFRIPFALFLPRQTALFKNFIVRH